MISLKGKVILVVDDEEGYREVLRDELNMAEATVLTASGGNEAFDIFKENKVDAIVTDIRMPDGGGVELLDRIKAINAKMPMVVLITGFTDLSPEEAYAKGADAIFSKPFNLDLLIQAIHNAFISEKERWLKELVRLPTDFTIELKVEALDTAITSNALGIGRGGMFVAFDGAPVNAGTPVYFRVTTKQESIPTFEGKGICRWFRRQSESHFPNGMGIEFTELNDESLQILSKLLKELKPLAYIPRGKSSK